MPVNMPQEGRPAATDVPNTASTIADNRSVDLSILLIAALLASHLDLAVWPVSNRPSAEAHRRARLALVLLSTTASFAGILSFSRASFMQRMLFHGPRAGRKSPNSRIRMNVCAAIDPSPSPAGVIDK